ncbi:unnamed protein product [Bursaphelenchus okinawaensis]|uniref:Nucleotide-diphospho-sugar transferase domain-containing protein n=1 Tax=Bursaphelenchus okinawaensis TaxID=465554 RepID=A0A811K1V6_9BILA|nr:unnamed protein product [Bursaphelenchus okinawaensis]CAG9088613.1 unnamed protein product [Bursaphelenchus okinawaensis]
MYPFTFTICRKVVLPAVGLYFLMAFVFYFHNLGTNPQPPPDWGFDKKKPIDGPLVMRDNIFEDGKVIGGVVLLNPMTLDKGDPPIKKLDSKPVEDLKVNEEFVKKLIKKSKDINQAHDLVLFTMINDAYLNLTLNWLCNTHSLPGAKIHEKIIFVTVGNETCQKIQKDWPKVECLEMKADTAYGAAMDWGTNGYAKFLEARLKLMLRLIEADLNLVIFEADAVWWKNPLKLFHEAFNETETDLTIPVNFKETNGQKYAFDPMCVRPTYETKKVFKEILKNLKSQKKLMDQDILNAKCTSKALRCKSFKWSDVADGKWFKMSQKERKNYKPYIVNNNYYIGAKNKMSRQALNNAWFLSPKGICNSSKTKKALLKHI